MNYIGEQSTSKEINTDDTARRFVPKPMREPGWYWVKDFDGWKVAEWHGSWSLFDYSWLCYDDDFTEIGDKIELPSKYKE